MKKDTQILTIFSAFFSLAILLGELFKHAPWPSVYNLFSFPFILFLFLGFTSCLVFSFCHVATIFRNKRLSTLLPLLICCASLAGHMLIPLNQWGRAINFYTLLGQREQVVQQIEAKTLGGTEKASYTKLPFDNMHVADGGSIWVHTDTPTLVFFPLWGFLDSSMGFLYCSLDNPPDSIDGYNIALQKMIQNHWWLAGLD